jgi:hypothetical protein
MYLHLSNTSFFDEGFDLDRYLYLYRRFFSLWAAIHHNPFIVFPHPFRRTEVPSVGRSSQRYDKVISRLRNKGRKLDIEEQRA